jgi:hypothetical protein
VQTWGRWRGALYVEFDLAGKRRHHQNREHCNHQAFYECHFPFELSPEMHPDGADGRERDQQGNNHAQVVDFY